MSALASAFDVALPTASAQLKGLPWLMHDWFYSTLAVGILFITSLELMLIGFVYVFFFLGLEEGSQTSGGTSTGTPSNSRRNESSGRIGQASRPANTHAKGSTSSSSTPIRHSPSGGHGSTATSTNHSTNSAHEDGLRRRPSAAGRTSGGATSRQHERPPPGVQAYQRGARYVVEEREPDAGSDIRGLHGAGGRQGAGEVLTGGVASSANVHDGLGTRGGRTEAVVVSDSSAGGARVVRVVGEENAEVLGGTEGGDRERVNDLTANRSDTDNQQ